jgi:chromosome segregation ATPase
MFRLNAELQAPAIEGMERARVLREELQRAKVQIAELAAEVKMRDEALQAKEAVTKVNDDLLQSKEALLRTITKSNDKLLRAKDDLLQAKDSQIQLLRARLTAPSAPLPPKPLDLGQLAVDASAALQLAMAASKSKKKRKQNRRP